MENWQKKHEKGVAYRYAHHFYEQDFPMHRYYEILYNDLKSLGWESDAIDRIIGHFFTYVEQIGKHR